MTLPPGYTLRPATLADAGTIAAHRAAMWTDICLAERRPLPEDGFLPAQLPLWESWLREVLASGTYLGWLLEEEARVVGGAGLLLRPRMPLSTSPAPVEGHILNVWVHPQARGRGLGRRLMGATLEGARSRGIQALTLNASAAGRPLYEALGFQVAASPEMRLTLGAAT